MSRIDETLAWVDDALSAAEAGMLAARILRLHGLHPVCMEAFVDALAPEEVSALAEELVEAEILLKYGESNPA